MTHYHVLGIRADADLATVRAAYLRLMKLHHPDRGRGADSDLVSRITTAYAVLRDPGQRADYDAQLHFAHAPQFEMQAAPCYERRHCKVAVTLLTAAFFAAFIPGDTLASSTGDQALASAAERVVVLLGRTPEPAAHKQPDLDPGIRSRVDIASYASLDEAGGVSRRCFSRLRDAPDVAATDRCVAFDLAFAYWYDGEFRGWEKESYFMPTRMMHRHEEAFEQAGIRDPGKRIHAIRAQTFATIMDILNRRREVARQTGR